MFHISELIIQIAQEFHEYWGYIDNFWVINSTWEIKIGWQTVNYWCQLQKKPTIKI